MMPMMAMTPHSTNTNTSTRPRHVLPQGIETVRRDNCLLVRNVVTTCLERILIHKVGGGGAQGKR